MRQNIQNLQTIDNSLFFKGTASSQTTLKQNIQNSGFTFVIGRGYYQLLKAEKIQEYKNIILEDSIGRMWEGSGVRNIFGIPNDSNNNKLSIK